MKNLFSLILIALLAVSTVGGAYGSSKPIPKAYSAPYGSSTRILKVSYSATAATSSTFQSTTRLIRAVCTTDCWVIVGTTATVANAMYLPIGLDLWLGVSGGQSISAIRASADGALSVSEFADP